MPKNLIFRVKSEGMQGWVVFDEQHRPFSFVVETDEDAALQAAKLGHPNAKQVVNALDVPLEDLQRLYYISMIQLAGIQMMMVQQSSSPLVRPH